MQGFWGILGLVLLGGPALACSPIEVGECSLPGSVDLGVLALFQEACLGSLHAEEFAVTSGADWQGIGATAWVVDPSQMSCDGVPFCADAACELVVMVPAEACVAGEACWQQIAPPTPLRPAP